MDTSHYSLDAVNKRIDDLVTTAEERFTALEAQTKHLAAAESSQGRAIGDLRRDVDQKLDRWTRSAEDADEELRQHINKVAEWAEGEFKAVDEWSEANARHMNGIKGALAVGGIAIAYLMGRTSR